jgi:DNA repair photolyase
MIISASRRTDIPALYSEWFINRIRAGWCLVPNPMNTNQVSRVSLKPEDVDVIVFWSKNPGPLIPYLEELDKRGFRYYFQFTVNNYPNTLEPNIPSLDKRLSTFRELSHQVTPSRVIWRYDPIIISNNTTVESHIENFSLLAGELKGLTNRVMVSIVDFYKKTDKRLLQLEKEDGFSFTKGDKLFKDVTCLMKELFNIASKNKIEIFTCAEDTDYSQLGILPGRCIDPEIMLKCWSLNLKYKKDPSQRSVCLCATSKDIGMNNTCKHACVYCYATTSSVTAERKFKEHNPDSPILSGDPGKLQEKMNSDFGQISLSL